MTLFKEKSKEKDGKDKMSLGLLLEYHKATWPLVSIYCWMSSHCINNIRIALMSGMFGAYGVLWVLKSNTFYDKNLYSMYETKAKNVVNYLSISIYYLFPWIASRNCNDINSFDVCIASFCYTVGGFLHYSADAQKFYTLKYRPNHLIDEGLFSLVQHPNYAGEFLMWIGLTTVADKYNVLSYIPIAWLYLATILVGIPQKRNSMKRFNNYNEWHKKTYNLVPFVW